MESTDFYIFFNGTKSKHFEEKKAIFDKCFVK